MVVDTCRWTVVDTPEWLDAETFPLPVSIEQVFKSVEGEREML